MSLQIKVCTGCYQTYNEGYLFDRWHEASSAEEVREIFKKEKTYFQESLRNEDPDREIDEDYDCEELYMSDYEIYVDGKFVKLDFGESYLALIGFLEEEDLESLNNPIGLLLALKEEYEKSLGELDDNVIYHVLDGSNDEYDLGYELAENSGYLDEASDFLRRYFDYESFGRDLILGGDYRIYEISGARYAVDQNCL